MDLIINADDFGLSKSITDGIIDGINGGYITSTTCMVNMPYAEYAIQQAIKNNIHCVGLHIVLTTGKPIIPNRNLTTESGDFYYNKNQINRTDLKYEDVYNEIKAQINQFDKFSKGKLKIDHLDMHHHLFSNEIIKKAVLDIANEYNLPVRNEGKMENIKTPDVLCSDFTIENVNLGKLKEILKKYETSNLIVELMTHCGYIDEYTKTITSYWDRNKELEVLKQAKQNGFFERIKLVNFGIFNK